MSFAWRFQSFCRQTVVHTNFQMLTPKFFTGQVSATYRRELLTHALYTLLCFGGDVFVTPEFLQLCSVSGCAGFSVLIFRCNVSIARDAAS